MRPLLRTVVCAGLPRRHGDCSPWPRLLALGRQVPLKMLPFDNKNELQVVSTCPRARPLERTEAVARDSRRCCAASSEVVDVTTYAGAPSPMDFNGMVRHYYLRHGRTWPTCASTSCTRRAVTSRATPSVSDSGTTSRPSRTDTARRCRSSSTPPGPPVIATLVAEVYGRPDHSYEDLVDAAETVAARMALEPGVVEVDTTVEADSTTLMFEPDHEKAAVSGISVRDISDTLAVCVAGADIGTLRDPAERQPLRVRVRLNQTDRRSAQDLGQVHVRGRDGQLVPLAELGQWRTAPTDKTIYHKNLQRVVYVFGETAGRPPADAVVDIASDRVPASDLEPGQWHPTRGWIDDAVPRPVGARTFASNGSGIAWAVPPDIDVTFRGEGEWKITLDVFRDLGLAFAAAMVGIYILLVAQTRSFAIPIIVMLAIPLTVIGIMPGFYLLNLVAGGSSGGYATPIFFTATAMIGMIALAGIVTRNSIIIIDFIHIALRRGRSLPDAIIESCSVRLRPILMTAGTAMLSAAPIAIDPIFSGLAWALIFGLFASTAFTLFVIPLVYWLLYANRPGHGVQVTDLDDA
jgi:multidrug efflux pump subunit AcrB